MIQLRVRMDMGKVDELRWEVWVEGAGSMPQANRAHFTILSKSGVALGRQSSLLPPPATRFASLFLNNELKSSKPVLEKHFSNMNM